MFVKRQPQDESCINYRHIKNMKDFDSIAELFLFPRGFFVSSRFSRTLGSCTPALRVAVNLFIHFVLVGEDKATHEAIDITAQFLRISRFHEEKSWPCR